MNAFHPNRYLVNFQQYYMHLNYFHDVFLMIDQLLKEKVMIMNDQIEVEVLQIYIEDYHYLFEVYNTLDTKIKEEEDEI